MPRKPGSSRRSTFTRPQPRPQALLERAWKQREQEVYPSLFGDLGSALYTMPPDLFADAFKEEADPRWLQTGVFECPPNPQRDEWLYVSSGLSNPWEQDDPAEVDEPSWLGLELLFRTTEQGSWAVQLVQRIAAFETLLAHGRLAGRDRLNYGDRIPLHGPIVPDGDSQLTFLLLAPPADAPSEFTLESGWVELVQLVGVTEAEAAFSREHGMDALLDLLRAAGADVVTNPARRSVVAD